MKDMLSLGLRHQNNHLVILDQQKLPHIEDWIEVRSPQEMATMIRRLSIRGAPLIGVAAALSLARAAEDRMPSDELFRAAELLRVARPTAVNLMQAVDRAVFDIEPSKLSPEAVVSAAEKLFDEDVALCRRIAANGEPLLEDGDRVLTHCNTGGLATAGVGTALGVIWAAHDAGKKIHVFVDETRPLLQGARLTSWELSKLGIAYTLVTDNTAGLLMRQEKITKVLVGADRIARNGDVANKIGTYSVAVLARYHQLPFYVAAPMTTVDLGCPSGETIPIEKRPPEEVRGNLAPLDCTVYNPAFDITPRDLITGLILDRGVYRGAPPAH